MESDGAAIQHLDHATAAISLRFYCTWMSRRLPSRLDRCQSPTAFQGLNLEGTRRPLACPASGSQREVATSKLGSQWEACAAEFPRTPRGTLQRFRPAYNVTVITAMQFRFKDRWDGLRRIIACPTSRVSWRDRGLLGRLYGIACLPICDNRRRILPVLGRTACPNHRWFEYLPSCVRLARLR